LFPAWLRSQNCKQFLLYFAYNNNNNNQAFYSQASWGRLEMKLIGVENKDEKERGKEGNKKQTEGGGG
jgi:hypothetical protein